jgi:hypothetical protein
MFAVTNDSGSVYQSTDGGTSWALVLLKGIAEVALAPSGTVFVIRSDTVFRSADNGISWMATTIHLLGATAASQQTRAELFFVEKQDNDHHPSCRLPFTLELYSRWMMA